MPICHFANSQSVRDIYNGLRISQSPGCFLSSFQIHVELSESMPRLALVSRLLLSFADRFKASGGLLAGQVSDQIHDFTTGFDHNFSVPVPVRLSQLQNLERSHPDAYSTGL